MTMTAVWAYLLKMGVCSAVLLGYYWLALRNERFHHWNRFYLLAAMFLSVVVPFWQLPIEVQQADNEVAIVLAGLPWNKLQKPVHNWMDWKGLLTLACLLVSALMLIQLLAGVFRVLRMYAQNHRTRFHEVDVVLTEEQSAPFSFFRWLFWRTDIDPDTDNGQRMLLHELTHIDERHSADKLFTEVLLIAFWMNPFFWIMRRELYTIHEFLADQKAIARHDGAAFAAMILQAAHPQQEHLLTNPFFSSHLKRRLIMITTSHVPQYSYLRRMSGLVLMLATGLVLMLTIERADAQPKAKAPLPPPPPEDQWNVLPDSIKSATVIDKNGVCYIKYDMKDGRKLLMELNEAKKKHYFLPPPPPPPPAAPKAPKAPKDAIAPVAPVQPATAVEAANAPASANSKTILSVGPANGAEGATTVFTLHDKGGQVANQPLFIYNGNTISSADLNSIDANSISEVRVLKAPEAINQYGEAGRNGVVLINSKQFASITKTVTKSPIASPSDPFAKRSLYKLTNQWEEGKKPLLLMNDKEISEEDLMKMRPEDVEVIGLMEGEDAVSRYGIKAKYGALRLRNKGC